MAPFDTADAGVATLGTPGQPGGPPVANGPIPMGAAPAAPEIQGPAPEAASFSSGGGVDQLGDLNLRPPVGSMRTGVSASPAEQLTAARIGTQANKLMASAPDPNAPMAWAKSWIGGLTGVLGSLGDAANVHANPGGGFLEGVTQTLANRNARLAQQKEQAAQQQHQKFEEQRETNKDALEATKAEQEQHFLEYQGKLNQIQYHKLLDNLSTEQSGRLHDQVKSWAAEKEEGEGTQKAFEGLTDDEMQSEAKKHEITRPNGTKDGGMGWLKALQVKQDGWKDDVDANGDTIPERDAKGELTGYNKRTPTFSAETYGEDQKMTKEFAAALDHFGIARTFQEGDTVPARVYDLYKSQAQRDLAEEAHAAQAQASIGKTKDEISKYEQSQAYRDANDALSPFVAAAGSYKKGLQDLYNHAAEPPDANGKYTPEQQKAQQMYQTVLKGLGPDMIKDMMQQEDKEEIETIKANAAKAKSDPLPLEGDTTLTGPAYAASLPPGKREIVTALGTGKAGPLQMARLLSGKDGQLLTEEMERAYPDFDGSKIKGYQDTIKEYNPTGKVGKQIVAINIALPHLDKLYSTVNAHPSTVLPVIGATEAYLGDKNAAAVQTTRKQASQELAQLYAAGAVTDQEHKEFAEELKTSSPAELKNNIETIVDLLQSKIQAAQDGWEKAAPSAAYRPPFQIVDPAAKAAMDHIQALAGNVPGTNPVAAREQQVAKTAPAKQPTQTITPGSHIFNSQKWAAANPGKDVEAAKKLAAQQGFQVQ